MAVINNPYIYSGGNVAFDSDQSLNTYKQIESARRAKEDAIDDYMRGLKGKITPTGMRAQDIPAFEGMRKQWQDYWVQNRDKIGKDPLTRAKFDSMAQDMLTFAELSKAEEAAKKPVIELFTDPTKRQKLRPEVFGMVAEHDKPLFVQDAQGNWVKDYNRKRLDYGSSLFKEPEFDFQKEFKGWTGEMKPGEITDLSKPTTDKQTGLVFYPTAEKYSPQQIASIGANAIRAIKDDEDKLGYYANRLAAISQKEYQDLDKLYKGITGDNIGKSPEKLAAAEAMQAAQKYVGKESMKPKTDYERRQQDKMQTIILKDSLKGSGGTGSDAQINDLYSKIEKAVDTKKTSGWFGRVREFTPLNDLSVDAQKMILDYAKELTGLTGSQQGVEILNNSSIKLKRNENGGIGIYDASNNSYIGELPRVGTNLKVQPSVKEKKEVIRRGEASPQKSTTNKWDKYKSN